MTDAQPLIQCLKQQSTLQMRHCQILEAQGRALLACDRPRFSALQDEYAQLLLQLQEQEKNRRALMQDEQGNPCTLTQLMENYPERSQKTLQTVRDGLRRNLDRAQELSRRNQGLIQNELKYFAFMLDLFVEAGRSAEAEYGGGGLGRRLLLDRRA